MPLASAWMRDAARNYKSGLAQSYCMLQIIAPVSRLKIVRKHKGELTLLHPSAQVAWLWAVNYDIAWGASDEDILFLLMSNNDNDSLLGFLKKKSLFSNSPNKSNRRRSRSRSRGSRDFDSRSNNGPEQISPTRLEEPPRNYQEPPKAYQEPPRALYQEQSKLYQEPPRQYQPEPVPAGLNFPPQQTKFDYTPVESKPPSQPFYESVAHSQPPPQAPVPSYNFKSGPETSNIVPNDVWKGLVAHTSSFESARLESMQCLDNLTGKIGGEVANLNYKLDMFNARMAKTLNAEFRSLRQRINAIFESAFRESEAYIKEYMQKKEAELGGELRSMRETLEKEQKRIDGMRQELNKPQWRKVAGEILATELEQKVEDMIKKSATLDVGQWDLGDLGGYRVKNIETELKEIVRLKT